MDCSTPGFPVHQQLLEFTQTRVNWVKWCHPTISSSAAPLFFLLSIFPSIRGFSNELALSISWPKYWSFSFDISPSNESSGISLPWLHALLHQELSSNTEGTYGPTQPGRLLPHPSQFTLPRWIFMVLITRQTIYTWLHANGSYPGGSGDEEPACRCRRCKRLGFDSWVGKIPWRRQWQPTPVFLLGETHGQRSLAGHSPWGRKESDTTDRLTHMLMSCIRTGSSFT